MGSKRVVKDDKKIQGFLKNAKGEDEVQLPAFSKEDDGTWVYDGTAYVRTLEDYKKYKQTYSELMGFIYENFNSSIAKLYKKTLNNLIFADEKDYDKEFIDCLGAKNGKPVSLGKLLATRENEDVQTYEDNAQRNLNSIVNLVRFVQGERKRYVPSEIIKFIKNEGIKDLKKAYLLPELTDKGIVTKIGRDSGNIEMNFVMVDEDVALAIRDDMISQLGDEYKPGIRSGIYDYFEDSKKLTEMLESLEDYNFMLKNFAQQSEYLFGLDPTGYLKKEKVQVQALSGSQDEIFADASGELVSAEESEINNANQNDAENLNTEFNVRSIQMNSPYASSTVIDGGNIAIKITPSDKDVSFRVMLDGEKLLVNETIEENNNEQMDK